MTRPRLQRGVEVAVVRASVSLCLLLVVSSIHAQTPAPKAQDPPTAAERVAAQVEAARAGLPPVKPWSGASEAFQVAADDPWVTPAEASGLNATPSYAETVAWLQHLVKAAPQLAMTSLGKSPEGRELWLVVASKEGGADAAALRRNGRATVLVQAGIHAGEIDGKDAGLMLLRDLTVAGRCAELLEHANLLFIPIFNVDGHERSSARGRINQRGPERMGWRTTAQNLNLNRDYVKADAPEMRALLRALNEWQPDLYVDVHVTDGVDYQYDITYGWNGPHAWSPAVGAWLDATLRPALDGELQRMGHVPGPLIFAADGMEVTSGIREWTATPRYSNGYGDARHLPTVLVENHSLKPYRRRVLGTYVLLKELLRVAGARKDALREAVQEDREAHRDPVPLAFTTATTVARPETMDFLGIRSQREPSPVMGSPVVRWLGEPVTMRVVVVRAHEPSLQVNRPAAWWVPAAWGDVIELLELHGIRMERQDAAVTREVRMYRVTDFTVASEPYEGRVPVRATFEREERSETFPPGSVRVPSDQPLGDLALLLLEPQSQDSLFLWGFFHGVLQETEYAEPYVMEPLGRHMLESDPELKAAFDRALAEDKDLAQNPRARLRWLYRRSAYFDERYLLYPVAREERE